jgi:hypothetical protein
MSDASDTTEPADAGLDAFLARQAAMVMPSSVPPGMRIELARARLKPGKGDRAAAWMQMLNDRYDECVATLPGEQMAFETIFFRTEADGTEWIYHLSVYGTGGGVLNEQSGSLDADHAAYSRECKERGWELLDPKFFLAPDAVRDAMVAAIQPGPTTN